MGWIQSAGPHISTLQPSLPCSGLLSLWLPIGFVQWEEPAGPWRVGGEYSGRFYALIPSALNQHWLIVSLHLRTFPAKWLSPMPCGSVATTSPWPQTEYWQPPTVCTLRVLRYSLDESLTSCHPFVRGPLLSSSPSPAWVCHLFPSRTLTDAVSKETILLM